MSIVTCHTEGCAAAGVGIELELEWSDPETGESGTVTDVFCGSCSQRISDIVDAAPDGPDTADDDARHA